MGSRKQKRNRAGAFCYIQINEFSDHAQEVNVGTTNHYRSGVMGHCHLALMGRGSFYP